MDIEKDLLTLMQEPERIPSRSWVEQAMAEHPYYGLPLMLYLQRAGVDDNEDVLDRLACIVPDGKVLMRRLRLDTKEIERQLRIAREQAKDSPDTEAAIDDFLKTYCPGSEREIDALNVAIFNPTPDYADILVAEEMARTSQGDKDDVHAQLMDSFIEHSLQAEQEAEQQAANAVGNDAEIAAAVVDPQPEEDNSMLSESLAKMYISLGRYEKALEIIQNINLKFPEKSIYFADQIRFLKKVILLKKHNVDA